MSVPSWRWLQWWGWSLTMSPVGPALQILGHTPGGRWHPQFVPWDWLMFCSTEQGCVLVCWWDEWSFLGQASTQLQDLPLFGIFPGWYCSISLHFFRSAKAIFLYFKICCCPWNRCCFRRQTDTVVKASLGLSTFWSARDVLELRAPHPISKLVPFPACALKTSACLSGFLLGTAVSYCKMSQDW